MNLARLVALLSVVLLAACSPAAPAAPTASPAAPAKPAASPAGGAPVPAGSPAAPADGPAAVAAASPAASPAASAAGAQPAPTANPALASNWAGKTVTLIVSQAPGGGYDTWARLVGKHISRFLPGTPNVVVQNMVGGDHKIATNFIYAAKPDGLTMGLVGRQIPDSALLNEGPEQGVRFEVAKLNWLGSPTKDSQVLLLSAKSGITNYKQLESQEMTLGGTTPGTPPHVYSVVLREGLGWKLRPIFGFEGTASSLLAIDRGEINGLINDWASSVVQRGDALKAKTLVPIVIMGDPINDPLLAGVPTADQLFKDRPPAMRELLEYSQQPFVWSRPFVTSPNMDPAILGAMRAAFMQTMADPQFLADAAQLKFDVSPVPGERVQQLIQEYQSTPKALVDRLNALVEADNPG
jgi:tripartite-type tricarboxylate transporter receptor subunit TctC